MNFKKLSFFIKRGGASVYTADQCVIWESLCLKRGIHFWEEGFSQALYQFVRDGGTLLLNHQCYATDKATGPNDTLINV